MAVISGIDGNLLIGASDITDVGEWSFSMSANNKEYGSSDTGGHTSTVVGRKSGSVSFQVKNNVTDPVWDNTTSHGIQVGDQVTLLARENSGITWTIPCRIESMEISVPIEEADVITLDIEAQAHGAWSYPDGTLSS